ncbi:MAG TPA: GNAT family N-acetyltransferase [Chloroflexota bacterium]|nr:GNAT family N-acetyltransferase [Chloroflexota bacterium]HUM72209.1 GNAT family N-acetyltransferase [Chloroflexota bacterium]
MIEITQANTDIQLEQVRNLKRAFLAWQKQTYNDRLDLVEKYFEPKAFENELASLPGKFAPPSGRLLVAYYDGIPAGTVALRDIGNQICEMKSMFVESQHLGKSIGRFLAEAIIQEARIIGYTKMRLDTGPRQIAAQTLYRSLGFREIKPYYELPQELTEKALFMELTL